MPEVRPATPADLPAIGRVLTSAFADDPVWGHLVPPAVDWAARAPAWFEADARSQMKGHGEVWVDDQLRGAAIWSQPQHWKGTAREMVALALPSVRLFRTQLGRSMRTISTMEKLHAQVPEHWYLAIVGTDPAHQGAGVGSALIGAVTDRCDEQGMGAYLESSKEQNVPFYERHGFKVRQEMQVPGNGPTMWLMWRDPIHPAER